MVVVCFYWFLVRLSLHVSWLGGILVASGKQPVSLRNKFIRLSFYVSDLKYLTGLSAIRCVDTVILCQLRKTEGKVIAVFVDQKDILFITEKPSTRPNVISRFIGAVVPSVSLTLRQRGNFLEVQSG